MAEQTTGSLIGRYQLVAPIGVGGMGRVWVAIDTASPGLRLVAVKTTLSGADAGMNPDFWAVLADEAGLASRINHPNVCATHELSEEAGTHFLVMDWSDGASLRDVLNALPGKHLTPELAAYVCAGVAAGLHAAHELADEDGHLLGVVHRDVSPQNVLVSTRGQIRLADFGVAKSRGQLHKATETGEVKGKLSYMAPEQVTSKNIDRRADIFALGCVLYEAALGVRPFHGADALATMYKILEEPLPLPSAQDPSFPQELERVIVKALAKDPGERYQTAEELREALFEYLSSTGRFFGDKQVVEVLSTTLGPELAERNRTIRANAERLRRGEKLSPRESPAPPRPHETLTPEGGVERTVTALHQQRRQVWTRVAFIAVSAVAVAAVAWGFSNKSAPGPSTGVVAGAPALTAPPAVAPPSTASPSAAVGSEAPPSAAPEPSAAASASLAGRARPTGARVTPRGPSSASPAAQPDKTPTRRPRPIDKDNIFENP
ncbi:MAG: serine/threonine protein kinase [Myxococcales bacterium]|nr:MAG: serine/threonine protein kinase [Myxococcales bacterium]